MSPNPPETPTPTHSLKTESPDTSNTSFLGQFRSERNFCRVVTRLLMTVKAVDGEAVGRAEPL